MILDTDPGIDDALALFLALASPEIRLEAITTVSGNVDVELTTLNALSLLTLTGRTEIPVARGSGVPLVRERVHAAQVHGRNGLGDVSLPLPEIQPVAQHAVDLIIEKILQAPGAITLVAIGPLTNLALAVRCEPRIAGLVREVVVMGGALLVPGNVTPAAAFQPDLITWQPMYVDVELTGTLTLGETVGYGGNDAPPAPNVQASVGVDSDRFMRMFLERMSNTYS